MLTDRGTAARMPKNRSGVAREHFSREPIAGSFGGGRRKVGVDSLFHRFRQLSRAVGTEQYCSERELVAYDTRPHSDRRRA